jgi:heat-inducible transcriptional repressor
MSLNRRSRLLLQLVVETYSQTVEPVSSRQLVALCARANQPHLAGLCSATLRHILASLTALGLLSRRHASAGCVPTELGLRAYIDDLLSTPMRPRKRDRLRLDALFEASHQGVDPSAQATYPNRLGAHLAALTGQLAVIARPHFLGCTVREVGLVRLDSARILAYFVSPGGMVQQRVVHVDIDVNAIEVQSMQNYLNVLLPGRSLAQVRKLLHDEIHDAIDAHHRLRQQVMHLAQQLLPEEKLQVTVEGTATLVAQPEFTYLPKLRALLATIAEHELLLRLIDGLGDAQGVQVRLGSDPALGALSDLAYVGCAHSSPCGTQTTIGLLGPARMNYGRVMPLVQHASKLLGQYWERI